MGSKQSRYEPLVQKPPAYTEVYTMDEEMTECVIFLQKGRDRMLATTLMGTFEVAFDQHVARLDVLQLRQRIRAAADDGQLRRIMIEELMVFIRAAEAQAGNITKVKNENVASAARSVLTDARERLDKLVMQ